MTDERRGSARHTASLAGELENQAGKTSIAITRDVSANGLLLYTRLRDCKGPVKLKVLHEGEEVYLTGTVVREEAVEDSPLWHTKLAITVDQSDPALAKIFAAIAAVPEPT